jgi:ATP-dependent RNA helicase RhlE
MLSCPIRLTDLPIPIDGKKDTRNKMKFSDLRLIEPIQRALLDEGYEQATPIQTRAIPEMLNDNDVLASAQTGTGKTAAFALPVLQKLHARPGRHRGPRCVVLAPTRELALQILDGFRAYGRHLPLRYTGIFGGVAPGPQIADLRAGVDVVVATPGRLLDLINQRAADLGHVEVFVLDEADRMLDMGFIADIRRIAQYLPAKRQTAMFSATMPPEIRKLAEQLLHHPIRIEVARVSSVAEGIDERVYFVERSGKSPLLAHLFEELPITRGIVFTRTKHGADRVVRQLRKFDIHAEAIHGNKSQNARQRALKNFKTGRTPLLIATDIASRGIDIDQVSHVINYDLTHEPETYVHRIGRTARAGATGVAVSFCDADERDNLRVIQKLVRRTIPVVPLPPNLPKPKESAVEFDDEHDDDSRPMRDHDSRRESRHDRDDRPRQKPQRHQDRNDRSDRRDRADDRRHAPTSKSSQHPRPSQPQKPSQHPKSSHPPKPSQPSGPRRDSAPNPSGRHPLHSGRPSSPPSSRSGPKPHRHGKPKRPNRGRP